jgi:hypothetical protein
MLFEGILSIVPPDFAYDKTSSNPKNNEKNVGWDANASSITLVVDEDAILPKNGLEAAKELLNTSESLSPGIP